MPDIEYLITTDRIVGMATETKGQQRCCRLYYLVLEN